MRPHRLLLDANIDGRTTLALRDSGHDVLSISETNPQLSDSEILLLARNEERILITRDKDFGELVVVESELHR